MNFRADNAYALEDNAPDGVVKVLRVRGAFGIKGLLRAFLLSDNLKRYEKIYALDGRSFYFRIERYVGGKNILINLDGVNDRTQALLFKGMCLYVKRSDLGNLEDDNEYYACDLVGKNVKVIDHKEIECKISNVYNFGAGDLAEIFYKGSVFLVPFKKENFPNTEEADKEILMTFAAFSNYKN